MLAPALLAVSIATLLTIAPAAAASPGPRPIPDPAPSGAQRPYEPDVAGPENLDQLKVSVTRHPTTRNGVTVAFDRHSRTADGSVPAAARRFVFLFDPAISFNLKAFPTCAADVVRAQGPTACPAGSQVGGGTSTNLQGATTPVYLLNTRLTNGDPGLLVSIPATGVLLEQTLEKVAAPYRDTYRLALDEIIQPNATPPQDRTGTSRFQLSFGATRTIQTPSGGTRTVSLVESSAPRNHPLDFALWSHFVTGQTVLPTSSTVAN